MHYRCWQGKFWQICYHNCLKDRFGRVKLWQNSFDLPNSPKFPPPQFCAIRYYLLYYVLLQLHTWANTSYKFCLISYVLHFYFKWLFINGRQTHIHACMQTLMQAHTHVHMHTYTHTQVHTHTHTNTHTSTLWTKQPVNYVLQYQMLECMLFAEMFNRGAAQVPF